jgi:hypothetical protein
MRSDYVTILDLVVPVRTMVVGNCVLSYKHFVPVGLR